jgi:hypothetical protein
MRPSDDVFFFTLIDFLLQVFFFGLLLFVAGRAVEGERDHQRDARDKQVDQVIKATGVSNISELSDLLTRLVPLDKLRGTADFISRNGGEKKVEEAIRSIQAAGGVDRIGELKNENAALMERVAKLEGWGKVSCLPNVMVNGRSQPKLIATAVVGDDIISLQDPTQEMHTLLAVHGLEFENVKRLSLSAFRSTFAPVVVKQPECRYFLAVRRETRYFEPMGAIWTAFRTL